ncbi:flagellar hook-basal body complex protein [Acetobacter peroxydans]|jgi:flagellar hook protein FlgE|uniref:flagellar hook-basal body complex protein n=1 Tax=Acetobacter peroxydans TaxID=104098 RepID=UPI0023526BED|nr:flagellar hook-basal body complex protein [Acetobacter peroxydans]MCH4142825.1 flagellar hook-basal body complex protein [Acetobacter peroxydans]MCI1394268.1 flagellar hook-basal body complex protein [Acetobacter peroxydans]MCI1411144.1 flagellar hook-basal body complex protein [Acetobacter peroxydans]MCI1438846.1 flagellar hook-basal body complex protein [Acetobacter peroxydans]MCI1566241.1 flagellar hook-basal body complex protein [Acetobacter peroxydans]
MSVFNALSTAVSGINAQSTAFTNLSNNISNSQTVGYKATTTAFQDFVAGAGGNSASADVSDSVAAVTVQHVDNQGTSSTSTDALATSISGNGLFVVSKGTTSGGQTYYTRNGEVYENKSGYLVNTSGYYLEGYMVDQSTGTLGTTLTQLNVSNVTFKPTETTTLTSTSTVGTSTGTDQTYTTAPTTVYDSTGTAHQIGLVWTQSTSDTSKWTVQAYDADGGGAISNASPSPYIVTFDSSTGAMTSVTDATGAVVANTTGTTAEIPITATYNGVAQTINVDLGSIGSTSGTVVATASSGTASTSQGTTLVAGASNTLTMDSASGAVNIGAQTGTDDTYMTTPLQLSDGSYVSAVWTKNTTTASTVNSEQTWTVKLVDPYSSSTSDSTTAQVTFKSDGTIDTINGSSTGSIAFTDSSGTTQTLNLTSSSVKLGSSSPYTDTTAVTSDSISTGTYEGVEITSDGSVMAQFSTGTQLIGKVALANFANVNGLEAVDGQAYVATTNSGNAQIGVSGENGTGTLSVGYVESSTTDLTKDLSSMIVAQEAYTANTKVVTSANTMLQATIAMIQ